MSQLGPPPSGTRDFSGSEVRHRRAAIATVQQVFESFGFDPLETPAMERVELLTGRYGEDEKLIFKIAKRGAKAEEGGADLALRYDLTVPLARVAAGRGALADPWRTYRIGPVWRADRPARGRFREFLQCDVDIVGSASPMADAEVVLIVTRALAALGITGFAVHLNSRRVLRGLVEAYGVAPERGHDVLVAVDKLHKIGVDGVGAELVARGVDETAVKALTDDLGAENAQDAVVERLASSPEGREGLAEVRRVQELVEPGLAAGRVVFDPFIARGLDYYTGPVFEVFAEGEGRLPLSIASGGRYDDLVSGFAGRPTPACGGSLGFERLLMLLEDAAGADAEPDLVLVTVWDDDSGPDAMDLAARLRAAGVRTSVSLGASTLGQQLKAANRQHARACVIRGPGEQAEGTVTVKDLAGGGQSTGPRDEVVRLVQEALGATPGA